MSGVKVTPGVGSLLFEGLTPGEEIEYKLVGVSVDRVLLEGEKATLAPAPTSIQARLSDDKTQVLIDAVPAATDAIHVAIRAKTATALVWTYSGTPAFPDLAVAAKSYTPPAANPEVSLVARKAGVDLGEWTAPLVTVPPVPAPKPAPTPTPAKSIVLPGLCINSTEGQVDWTRAATASAELGRTELTYGSLDEATTYAVDSRMGIIWIDQNETLGLTLDEYRELSPSQRATVAAIEKGNEWWPGGIGKQYSGKQCAELFIESAAEKKAAGLSIPLLMQTRLAKDIKTAWMDSLATVDHAKLKQALEGNGLASHPYYGLATSPQREPKNLADYHDVDGNEWGFQRWLKEQQYIRNLTGLTVPMWITEIGFASAPGVPQSVGSAAAVTSHIKALWQHAAEARDGKILLPDGTPASLRAVVYYDEYAWHPSESESLGILVNNSSKQQVPRTEAGIYEAWVAGAKALVSA
jgi:hypothetical protein